MTFGRVVGVVAAVVLHAAFLLFGGLLLPEAAASAHHLQEVELLAPDEPKKEEPPPETPPDAATPKESPPDAADVIRNLEPPAADSAPALDAASLASIGEALLGQGGGGDFGGALSFASGGRIGGTGKGGELADTMDKAFSLADIDQRPVPTFQAEPTYPVEMRHKKVEGVVSMLFVVDATGKVTDPRVEKSSHPAFEKPAIDALRQWKFEPAVKSGKRVACKTRLQIRFPPP